MKVVDTDLPGLKVIEFERSVDDRGYFVRNFAEDEFREHGLEARFVQQSVAYNNLAGTVRGLHYQRAPFEETKLVRCSKGAAFDVVVDIRPRSRTYLKTFSIVLDDRATRILYVPQGFAHGYQCMKDATELSYAISTNYAPQAAIGLRWDDPALGIAWPLPVVRISTRDREWPLIGTHRSELPPAGS